jgi:RNA polymerase sigma factor (sigma-70 family)
MTDQDLIRSCLHHDRKAQKELYDRFAPVMYAICIRYTRNTDHARDVLQDGFIKTFGNLSKFRSEGSFEGWMKRIFIHTAVSYYHKLKANNTFLQDDGIQSHPETDSPDAIDRLSEKELLQLISKLPDGYRIVFNLSVLEGYSHDEIASMLSITASTSRSQLLKARRMLQMKISEMKIFEI